MIVQTGYFDSTKEDVGRFLDYLDKGFAMENDLGHDIDDIDKTRFAQFAEKFDTARMATISPSDGTDQSDWDMLTASHRAMREYGKGRYSLRYMAAIHRDTDHDHVQLCIVGQQNDIEMDRDDLKDFQQTILDNFGENELGLIQERLDGRTVDEAADEQIDRASSLKQATLPHPAQHAEQIELDQSLDINLTGGPG